MPSNTVRASILALAGILVAVGAAVFFGGSSGETSVLAGGDDAEPTEEPTEGEEEGEEGGEDNEGDEDGDPEPEADDAERPFADFLSRLAQNLGISQEELEEALRQTKLELIDEAEADGRLSAERADELRQAIEDGEPGFPFAGGLGGPFVTGSPPFGAYFHIGPLEPEELAEFLGLEVDELLDMQAEGTTLAALAEANGRSRQELIEFLSQPALERIDQALADGEISEEEAAEKRERVNQSIERLIDASFNAEECQDPGLDMADGESFGFQSGRGFCFHMEFSDGGGDVEETESALIT
jgi:uncharacterized protein YidB (DUF937 family)